MGRLALSIEQVASGGGYVTSDATIEFVQVRADVDINKRQGHGRNADTCKALQKTLGKPMPDRSTVRLLYPSSTQGNGGSGGGSKVGGSSYLHEALEPLRCSARGGGSDSRVYIGLGRTEQTCGSGFHICAHLLRQWSVRRSILPIAIAASGTGAP